VNGIPRVVFDTNILFSSVGWLGKPHQCVQAARRGECLSLICEPILTELNEKLQAKRGLDAAQAAEIHEEICAFSKLVTVTGTLRVVAADPDDDPVVECAIIGQAQFIVTGDHHLLSLEKYGEIKILKAADFLESVLRASGT
jgi:putative PIN family toxin of toxin-antitoxin system